LPHRGEIVILERVGIILRHYSSTRLRACHDSPTTSTAD
jgi:hypothetical protein